MAAKKDYYKLLDLPKTATQDDIKKSYHKLAKKYHPDKNPNNPDSAEKFKAIKEAYEVLSDPAKKAEHDLLSKKPANTNPTQTRYESSNFPNFPKTGFKAASSGGPGPKIFTFNVYGNASGVPLAEIFKMFFGGMADFGPSSSTSPPRTARRPPNNPNNAALCQFCKQLFSVPELIMHQKICPRKPTTTDDFENIFPSFPGSSSNRPHDWRQQHQDTLNAIKRDRERASKPGGNNWTDSFPPQSNFEYELHQSGLVECPHCNRRFNIDAASHHIPHCRQKSNEDNFRPHNTPKPNTEEKTSSFYRAKEYAKNIKKMNQEDNHNNTKWDSFDTYWDQDEEEYMSSAKPFSGINERDLYSQFCNFSAGYMSNRNQRKSTFPDIHVKNGIFSEMRSSGKSRRNTSSDIFDAGFPSGHKQFPFNRSHYGCDNCIRLYGFEEAKIHCSCAFKKATNLKHK